MNCSIDACSSCVWAMRPRRAYGLTSNAGTRKPRPNASIWRGRLWSYQPPQLLYVSMSAELLHDELRLSAVMTPRTNAWPFWRLEGGCSLGPAATMYDTAG